MAKKRTKLEWQAEDRCQELAGQLADELAEHFGLVAPIDPLEVVRRESRMLVAGGRDFGNKFDGKLKYNKEKKKFVLLFNTKYDTGLAEGRHPRTRFSICHELGHYFIEAHNKHLRRGGPAHPSSGEFRSAMQMEREADAFASSFLLPTRLAGPVLTSGELNLDRIERVATDFQTSMLCTTIRGVRLSDLPCAVAGLRDGCIAWMFPSKSLIAAGCYPGKKQIESPTARARWEAFAGGDDDWDQEDTKLCHWFETYDREDELWDVEVTQSFLPVRSMGTVVVLLTLDEDDVVREEGEEEDEIDKDHRERYGW